jgi:hypothetical protein
VITRLLFAWLCLATTAHAQTTNDVVHDLAPRKRETLDERAHRFERDVSAWLEKLPEVRATQVLVSLPDVSELPLDQPAPQAVVRVLMMMRGGRPPDEDTLRTHLQELDPALADAQLDIRTLHVSGTTAPSPQLAVPVRETRVEVGPFHVSETSAAPLRIALGLSLIANVTLATLLLGRLRRRSRARHTL